MRLLTISNCPLVASQGSGYITLGFAEGLRRRGWTVDVLGPEQIDPWPHLGRARSWRMAIGMLRWARRRLRSESYDIVEFYGGEAWLAISVLARWRSRKFLIVSHSNGLEPYCEQQLQAGLGTDTLDGRPRRWFQVQPSSLMAAGFRNADALVTVSEFDASYARQHAYQPEPRLLAIDNPLPESFLSVPVSFDRAPIVAYCGSWIPRKGTGLIVKDMCRILREFRECRLRLIGVGSAFRTVEHFPDDVRSRIEVVPFLSDKETLRSAYRECAVVIAPSVYESFGMTIAEGMACGCALVANRTGFAAGLRNGVEARLLPAPSSPHLYALVRELLLDPVRRKEIAAAGYEHVQRLKWDVAVDRLATAYQSWRNERQYHAAA
jgi:glycosyltransferase involved in cell wall biosynthesis